MTPERQSVLFVCVENSCRSQMAEGFAHMLKVGNLDIHSAGSKPSGQVNPRAIQFMAEVGYDLSQHKSLSVDEVPQGPYDAVITMGCGDACPLIKGRVQEDWGLDDPKHLSDNDFRVIRDEIKARVSKLLSELSA